jgi:hypothetical protein
MHLRRAESGVGKESESWARRSFRDGAGVLSVDQQTVARATGILSQTLQCFLFDARECDASLTARSRHRRGRDGGDPLPRAYHPPSRRGDHTTANPAQDLRSIRQEQAMDMSGLRGGSHNG